MHLQHATPSLGLGAKAVYPAYGVTEVVGIESREVGGQTRSFYVLRVLAGGEKIMVPTDNTDAVGLRGVMDPRGAREVFDVLRQRPQRATGPWNRRQREYLDKIRTGAPAALAAVVRDLTRLGVTKDLSFSERKLLDQARSLLVAELAVARRRGELAIRKEIDRIFGRPD